MTKKDNSTPQAPNSSDFFSDIANELQSQVEGLNPNAENGDPSFATSTLDGTSSEGGTLTSEQSTLANAQNEEADGIFDNETATPDTEIYDNEASSPSPTNGAIHDAETIPADTAPETPEAAQVEETPAEEAAQVDAAPAEEAAQVDAALAEEVAQVDAAPAEEMAQVDAAPAEEVVSTPDTPAEAQAASASDEQAANADVESETTDDETDSEEPPQVSLETSEMESQESGNTESANSLKTTQMDLDVALSGADSSESDRKNAADAQEEQEFPVEVEAADEDTTAPIPKTEEVAFEGSKPQSEVQIGPHPYCLEQAIFQSADRVVWRASRSDGSSDQLFLVEEISIARYENGYKSMPDLYQVRILRPDVIQEMDDRIFLIFRKPTGHRLKERLEDRKHQWSLAQIRHIIRTIGHSLAGIHETRHLFLQLDARHIWMEDNRDPLLLSVERLYSEETPFHTRPVREGFSAPEIFQRNSVLGPYTDIFALGALLHYLISHAPLFNHLDTPNPHIPSPRIYNPSFPVGFDPIIFKACHPDPTQRYQRVSQFIGAFERALRLIEERLQHPKEIIPLAVGHDIHIGVSKGNRNPVNQDALFWRYDRVRGKGLFVVADGVSHCNYGSGDRASSLLIQAARKRWDTIVQKPIMDEELNGDQRRQILRSIVDAANNAIGREINSRYERIDGYVEDVMGSTWVAGFLDGNHMTLANLGDSRAYLKHADSFEQVTIDHDYKTAQMQAHLDLRSIASLMGGSLITRCVGSFEKDENLKLIPRSLDIDFFDLTLLPGDVLLLCSDGLSDYAGNDEEESKMAMSRLIDNYPDPLSACFWMIALANQHGGGDNISMIEIKVLE